MSRVNIKLVDFITAHIMFKIGLTEIEFAAQILEWFLRLQTSISIPIPNFIPTKFRINK